MGDNNDHYQGAILEDIQDKMQRVLEGVAALSGVPGRLTAIEIRLDQVEEQLTVLPAIKAAITEMNADLRDHEDRITRLERAA
jgi:hypothetical protein